MRAAKPTTNGPKCGSFGSIQRGVINQQIGRVAHEIGRVAMRPPLAQIETANVSGSAYPIAFSSEVDAGSRKKTRQNNKLEPGSDLNQRRL